MLGGGARERLDVLGPVVRRHGDPHAPRPHALQRTARLGRHPDGIAASRLARLEQVGGDRVARVAREDLFQLLDEGQAAGRQVQLARQHPGRPVHPLHHVRSQISQRRHAVDQRAVQVAKHHARQRQWRRGGGSTTERWKDRVGDER